MPDNRNAEALSRFAAEAANEIGAGRRRNKRRDIYAKDKGDDGIRSVRNIAESYENNMK